MLDTLLREVVGGRTATVLDKKLGLRTVRDLLTFYPRRYAERGQLTDLRLLKVDDDVTIMATVQTVKTVTMRTRRGSITEVTVSDGSGRVGLTFFNQPWREKELRPGRVGLFAGKVSEFGGKRKLNTPDYVLLDGSGADDADTVDEFAGSIIPVYPGTAGLPSWTVGRSVRVVLDSIGLIKDPLPDAIRAEVGLVSLDAAYRGIHRPEDWAERARARRRLAWDEALGIQLTLAQRRNEAFSNPAYPRPGRPGGLADEFDRRLPFTLTAGQREVGEELSEGLSQTHPMQRLLQGEVGSGKTVVALRAMLQAIDSGAQTALLAPTEVLATQHARTFEKVLGDLSGAGRFGAAANATRVTLLTASLTARARREALLDVASGAAGIVVGTHSLIQKSVEFADLGLVVVDEQHRFGVEQRDALRAKSAAPPHLLVMTATPIPRTVAMTVFGDLDVSTLTELPAGRSPITTTVVPDGEKPTWLDRAWVRVVEEVAAGRQAYVVCPRIGDEPTPIDVAGAGDRPGAAPAGAAVAANPANSVDSGSFNDIFDGAFDGDFGGDDEYADDADLDATRPTRALLQTTADLQAGPLASVRVGVLHGRMSAEDKDATMTAFAAGKIDVLLATTVIEVGVDVPNATIMVILDAERFGVSSLHQLRGRVGRGDHPGICLLVTQAPAGTAARERLDAVAAEPDGFRLARVDLAQRREGDVLGASQSGRRSHLKLLSLLDDEPLIVEARAVATRLIEFDPQLDLYPLLAAQVAALVDEERSRYLAKS